MFVGKNSCYPLRVLHTELVKGNMRSSGEDILHMPIHPLQHCEIQLLGAILIQLWQGLTRLLLLCCHASAFPENTSSNFSPTPLNIQKPKKKKHTHTPTNTTSLTHTTKQSPTSLPFPFLSFLFLSFPFLCQQRKQIEPLGSAPTTPKPFQIAMQKTTLSYNLLFHTKERWRRRRRRGTHCFEREQGHKWAKMEWMKMYVWFLWMIGWKCMYEWMNVWF